MFFQRTNAEVAPDVLIVTLDYCLLILVFVLVFVGGGVSTVTLTYPLMSGASDLTALGEARRSGRPAGLRRGRRRAAAAPALPGLRGEGPAAPEAR